MTRRLPMPIARQSSQRWHDAYLFSSPDLVSKMAQASAENMDQGSAMLKL